jgi:uncharacterized membrane protein (UPF0127 family)
MRKLLAVLLLSLFVAGCAVEGAGQQTRDREPQPPDSELRTLTIHTSDREVEVRVEVADTEAERRRGLMGRESLGEDRGMLFVFDSEQTLSFWMKDTRIPLSIAYIDAEGRIVDIQKMEPLDDDPPNYISAEPARYALEVNRGFFEEHGVEVGDRAELPG